MRWQAPSDRALFWLLSPVIIPVLVLGTPVMLALAGLVWLHEKLYPPHDWKRWFAWRPVRLDQYPSEWAWLKPIEARRLGFGRRYYRALGDLRHCRDEAIEPRQAT